MSLLLGLGLGLGNVQKSMADYFAKRDEDERKALALQMQLQGGNAYDDPNTVKMLERQGVKLAHGTAGAPNVSATTGVVIPEAELMARRERATKSKQMGMQDEIYDLVQSQLHPKAQQPAFVPNIAAQAAPMKARITGQPMFVPNTAAPQQSAGRTSGVGSSSFVNDLVRDTLGLSREPTVEMKDYDPETGQETVTRVPESQAVGVPQRSAPPATDRTKAITAGNILDQLDEAAKLYNPKFVGPYADWGYQAESWAPEWLRQGHPSLQQDPNQTAFYNSLDQLTEERLRMLTGAAVAKEEWPRISGMLPNKGQQPEKFAQQMQSVRAYIASLRDKYAGAPKGTTPAAGPQLGSSQVAAPGGAPQGGAGRVVITPAMVNAWAQRTGVTPQEAARQIQTALGQQ